VEVQEIGGSFSTRAIVRGVRVGTDHLRRLGIQFLDRQLPDRFLPADYSTPHSGAMRVAQRPAAEGGTASVPPPTPAPQRAPPSSPAASAEAPAVPARRNPPPPERREHSRLGIHIELRLRRLDAEGRAVEEERTVADDVSRGGLRLLTSLPDVAEGDVVEVEEVDGDFKTRARVVSRALGRDQIPRLGLQFLDNQAPDRLVAEDERSGRGHTKPVKGTPPPASPGSE
jgi:hypothetical protein